MLGRQLVVDSAIEIFFNELDCNFYYTHTYLYECAHVRAHAHTHTNTYNHIIYTKILFQQHVLHIQENLCEATASQLQSIKTKPHEPAPWKPERWPCHRFQSSHSLLCPLDVTAILNSKMVSSPFSFVRPYCLSPLHVSHMSRLFDSEFYKTEI